MEFPHSQIKKESEEELMKKHTGRKAVGQVGPFQLNAPVFGDALELAKQLPDESIHCCVTSPPYWGLRDYGACSCSSGRYDEGQGNGTGGDLNYRAGKYTPDPKCKRCAGTGRVIGTDNQLGLEKTPEEYVAKLVALFREIRRALRADGVLWLNLGDCYATGAGKVGDCPGGGKQGENWKGKTTSPNRMPIEGLKPKDLVGIPWMVAFALRADGWYLRSDIIWSKPNPMPESVTDRPTKAHEYVFLMAKSERYYYDATAIREPHTMRPQSRPTGHKRRRPGLLMAEHTWSGTARTIPGPDGDPSGRNKRTVWTIATKSYPSAHFATFPPDLIKPCILAGTSKKGRCPGCGVQWTRVIERAEPPHVEESTLDRYGTGQAGVHRKVGGQYQKWLDANPPKTTGWKPGCTCELEVTPSIVLDPFLGSGTTGQVCQDLGRSWVGFELNEGYAPLIARRTAQQGLF